MNRYQRLSGIVHTCFILLAVVATASGVDGAVLKGTLVSDEGKPVNGVTVRLVPGGRSTRWYLGGFEAVTSADGTFEFKDVKPGDYAIVYGNELSQGRFVTVREKGNASLRCVLRKDETILLKGKMAVPQGDVAHYWVTFTRLDPAPDRLFWPPPVKQTKVNTKGSYEVRISPGRYLVGIEEQNNEAARRDGFKPEQLEQADLSPAFLLGLLANGARVTVYVRVVEIDKTHTDLNLALSDHGINGTVTVPPGKPVPPIVVSLSPSELQNTWEPMLMSVQTSPDAKGKWRMPHVGAGTYDIVVSQSAYGDEFPNVGTQCFPRVKVQKDQNASIHLDLKEAAAINTTFEVPPTLHPEVKVVGTTETDCEVMAISENEPKVRSFYPSPSLPKGVLGPGLAASPMIFPEGKYLVLASTNVKGLPREIRSVNVSKKKVDVDFRFVACGAVTVKLQGAASNIGGRTVRLWDESGKAVPRLYNPLWSYDLYMCGSYVVLPTGPDGITIIEGLRPGKYTATVDGTKARVQFEIQAGKMATVSISLGRDR